MKMLRLCLFFACTAVFAGDLLPLQPGNYWTYREVNGSQSFTVRVGTPLATQNGVYARLTGYVRQPLWVRYNKFGSLVYLNEEADRDELLTSFETVSGAWAVAPFRPCEQETQVDTRSEGYSGPVGEFTKATHLQYRSFSCADAGVTAEVYLPSIGLVRRTESSIAGPRVFELAEARVGGLLYSGKQSGGFDVSTHYAGPGSTTLPVTLRLSLMNEEDMMLAYATSQEYDISMWNDKGQEIYRWSSDKVFTQGVWARWVHGTLTHRVEIPLKDASGQPLPAGNYVIHAWLTAGPGGAAYSAMTTARLP